MVFIGPQASGKSTLAKLIDMFLEVRKEYRSSLIHTIALHKFLETDYKSYDWSQNLASHVREIFKKRFPFFTNGKIIFCFDANYQIDIDVSLMTEGLENDVKISKAFFDELIEFENKIKSLFPEKNPITSNRELSIENLSKIISNQLLNNDSYIFFNTRFKLVDTFIPSGRILISVLSNSISFIENNNLDVYNEDFIKLTNRIRIFSKGSSSSNLFGRIDKSGSKNEMTDKFAFANKLAFKVLKGDFHSSTAGDGIIHYSFGKEGVEIPLRYTSSGQQEASWLINTIHYLLAESNDNKTTLYTTTIEEPETHLFPEAQRDITYLITLLANQPNSKIVITTHSPYILASLNNLIEANLVGKEEKKRKAVSKVINPMLWINSKKLYVGYLDNGIIEDIIDQETHLIKHEILDSVSDDIMSKFDNLLEIQYDE